MFIFSGLSMPSYLFTFASWWARHSCALHLNMFGRATLARMNRGTTRKHRRRRTPTGWLRIYNWYLPSRWCTNLVHDKTLRICACDLFSSISTSRYSRTSCHSWYFSTSSFRSPCMWQLRCRSFSDPFLLRGTRISLTPKSRRGRWSTLQILMRSWDRSDT